MSDHPRRIPSGTVALAAALLLSVELPAGAQRTAGNDAQRPTVASERARVARFAEDLRRAEAAVQRARIGVTEGVALDTIRRGPLVVLVEPADRDSVSAAAARSAAVLEQTYGSAALRLASTPIVIRRVPASKAADDSVRLLAITSTDGMLRAFEGEDEATIAHQLTARGIIGMRALMDRALQEWIGTYRTSSGRPAMFVAAFEELATSASPLGRRCLVADLLACRETLVLRERDDALWRWYDASYRREFVRGKRRTLRASAPERLDACVDGDDAACDAVLRSAPRLRPEPPIGMASRHSLVSVALELGGPDAMARLLDTPGRPIDERLGAAAGVPVDSLVAVWQSRVARAAPRRAGFPARSAAASLAWILLFAFLSTRSTRWR